MNRFGAPALAVLAFAPWLACQEGTPAHFSGAAGMGGASGAGVAGVGGAPTLDASADDTAPPAATCNKTPTPARTSGGTLMLAVEPRLGGKTFVFGEPNAAPGGGTVMPLNLRFYVAQVALLRAAGAPVLVDLVTAAGAPEPYGVHFFNAEEPASQTLRVLAPAGSYTGFTFMLGIDDACNSEPPTEHVAPLNGDSQMTWPHLAGYLFLRYEGQVTPGDAPDAGADAALPPTMIHMGGAPGRILAPTLSVTGAFTIAVGQPTSRPLFLDMDAVFLGATSEVDPSTLSPLAGFPEVLAGDRLRQHAPRLPLFVLGP